MLFTRTFSKISDVQNFCSNKKKTLKKRIIMQYIYILAGDINPFQRSVFLSWDNEKKIKISEFDKKMLMKLKLIFRFINN